MMVKIFMVIQSWLGWYTICRCFSSRRSNRHSRPARLKAAVSPRRRTGHRTGCHCRWQVSRGCGPNRSRGLRLRRCFFDAGLVDTRCRFPDPRGRPRRRRPGCTIIPQSHADRPWLWGGCVREPSAGPSAGSIGDGIGCSSKTLLFAHRHTPMAF